MRETRCKSFGVQVAHIFAGLAVPRLYGPNSSLFVPSMRQILIRGGIPHPAPGTVHPVSLRPCAVAIISVSRQTCEFDSPTVACTHTRR